MIKFIFKIIIFFCVAFSAIIYHNTDAGKEMEKKIGQSLEFSSIMDHGKKLVKKTIHFILMEGMDSEDEVKKENKKKISPPTVVKTKEGKEKIDEDERKRIEEIIESEG